MCRFKKKDEKGERAEKENIFFCSGTCIYLKILLILDAKTFQKNVFQHIPFSAPQKGNSSLSSKGAVTLVQRKKTEKRLKASGPDCCCLTWHSVVWHGEAWHACQVLHHLLLQKFHSGLEDSVSGWSFSNNATRSFKTYIFIIKCWFKITLEDSHEPWRAVWLCEVKTTALGLSRQ